MLTRWPAFSSALPQHLTARSKPPRRRPTPGPAAARWPTAGGTLAPRGGPRGGAADSAHPTGVRPRYRRGRAGRSNGGRVRRVRGAADAWCWSARRPAARLAPAPASRTIPGFPDGITGLELTQRTYEQARRFDAEFVLVNEVTAADPSAREPFRLSLLDGTELRSRSVLLATGVEYRFLDVPGVAELTGRGICYRVPRQRGVPLPRGRAVRHRKRQFGSAGGGVLRHTRAAGEPARPRRLAGPQHVRSTCSASSRRFPNLTVRYHTEVAAAEGTDRSRRWSCATTARAQRHASRPTAW